MNHIGAYARPALGQEAQERAEALGRGDGPREKDTEAAQAFESYFVEAMLQQMRKTIPRTSDADGDAMEMFEGMFDGAIAERIASGKGIGLADMIEKSLNKLPHPDVTGPVMGQGQDFGHLVDMGRVSSAFGLRKDPFTGALRQHKGVDIALGDGTPVRPIRPGQVVFSGTNGGYGQVVVVDHGEGLRSTYAHLRDRVVEVGERVDVNQVLGHVGSTGRSTGPHLHLEVSADGQLVDPEEFLQH